MSSEICFPGEEIRWILWCDYFFHQEALPSLLGSCLHNGQHDMGSSLEFPTLGMHLWEPGASSFTNMIHSLWESYSPRTDSGVFKWKNTCLPSWWCRRRWDVEVKGIMEMHVSGPRVSSPDVQDPRVTSQLQRCPRSCKYWLKVRKDPSSSDIPPRSLLGSLFTN